MQRRNHAIKVRDDSAKKLKELMKDSDFEATLQTASIWIAQDQERAQAKKFEKGTTHRYLL